LRVGQWAADGGFRVEVVLEGAGARRSAVVEFPFEVSAQDREDLRWYLEDFLLYPLDPAPLIAERVQARAAELGGQLFDAVFAADRDALRVWEAAGAELSQTRVEVVAEPGGRWLPWELARDPATDGVLALRAGAFVRGYPGRPRRRGRPSRPGGCGSCW
jgi:hypothetical protein